MVVYQVWLDAIHELPEALQGELALSILEVGLEGKVACKIGQTTKALLALIRPQIEANNRKFENGLKGGRKPNPNQTETKEEPKGNQTETKEEPNPNQSETYMRYEICDNISLPPLREAHERACEELPNGTYVSRERIAESLMADDSWVSLVAKNLRKSKKEVQDAIEEFGRVQGLYTESTEISAVRIHFVNWFRKLNSQKNGKAQQQRRGGGRSNSPDFDAIDRAVAEGIASAEFGVEW